MGLWGENIHIQSTGCGLPAKKQCFGCELPWSRATPGNCGEQSKVLWATPGNWANISRGRGMAGCIHYLNQPTHSRQLTACKSQQGENTKSDSFITWKNEPLVPMSNNINMTSIFMNSLVVFTKMAVWRSVTVTLRL